MYHGSKAVKFAADVAIIVEPVQSALSSNVSRNKDGTAGDTFYFSRSLASNHNDAKDIPYGN